MPRLADLLSEHSDRARLESLAATSRRPPRGGKQRSDLSSPQRLTPPDFVALDLETTGLHTRNDRITEIGAVRYVAGKPESRYSTLVNPGIPIPPLITRLTSITDAQVATAPPFEALCDELVAFIGRLPICGHQIDFDISFLNEMLSSCKRPPLRNPPLDTATLSRVVLVNLPGYALGAVAAHLGITLKNAHRALDDAQASGQIALKLIPRLMDIPPAVRRDLASFCPRSLIKKLLTDSLMLPVATHTHEKRSRPCGGRPEPYSADMRVATHHVANLLESGSALKEHFGGFTPRRAQQEMGRAVGEALNQHTFLVAEAGTGTGKSLGYLIPAALFALHNNCRVLVSTHTRNLQDQLCSKDLPLVSAACGGNLRFSVLKGRGNYLCLRRYTMLLEGTLTHLSSRERFGLLPLIRWAGQTHTGDIEEQNQFNRNWHRRIWDQIAADAQECAGYRCTCHGECFLQQARRAAQSSHIVIINHSLFFSELCAESPFLDHHGPIVFDEAHHLHQTGLHCLRVVVDTNRLNLFTERGSAALGRLEKRDANQETVHLAMRFKKALRAIRLSTRSFAADLLQTAGQKGQGKGTFQLALSKEPFGSLPSLAGLRLELDQLAQLLHDLQQKIGPSSPPDAEDSLAGECAGVLSQLLQLRADLGYVTDAAATHHAFWLEGSHEKGWFKLCGVPLDIAGILSPWWSARQAALVFTSATLSIAGSIDFFAASIGLDGNNAARRESLLLASPFVASQSLRIALSSPPEPNDPSFERHCAEALAALSSATRRSMLVLFTANALLESVYALLEHDPRLKETPLFAQGIGATRHAILEAFRATPGSVLLGSASFWEGIDVAGSSCEMVVIPRLPFTVPTDPLAQALAERARETHGESFFSHTVPEAVIRFRQGCGRLIRTAEDRGALVVLDNRIITKGYGAAFARSLDGGIGSARTLDVLIEQVRSFFENPPCIHEQDTITLVPIDEL